MRAVVQRVRCARVEVDGRATAEIGRGLLVYLGVGKGDDERDAAYIAQKIAGLRIFADQEDKMNLSLPDVGGEVLVVSQFTLYGDCRKGRRPGFDEAAEPTLARRLYEKVCELMEEQGVRVGRGEFGAKMKVESVNDGPVTFLLESGKGF